jgi:predicted metal-dependent phosphotriesterase family hydrolase
VPELTDVFQIIAKNNLVLETGHSTPQESLILIPAAKQAGVKNIIVTHAMLLGATLEQVKQMADMGAVIEFCWQTYLTKTGIDQKGIATCVNVIQTLGAAHFIIDSDLGQKNNPLHPDGMLAFITALKANGLNEHDIDLVARKNPAMLLGLDPIN